MQNKLCPKCQTRNYQDARFCEHCGFTLEATLTQGRTVVAPAPLPLSATETKTIVQRVQQAFAVHSPMPGLDFGTLSRANQREHVIELIDRSGSMGEPYDDLLTKLEAAQRADISLILQKAQIDLYDMIGLAAFRSTAEILHALAPVHSNKRQFIEAIQSLTPDNGTDINEGLKMASDLFDWSCQDVVRRIVLLTDGHGGHPLGTAEDLKSRGVVIDVIGIGDKNANVAETLLRNVASVIEGESRYRFIKDMDTLVRTYTQLANKTATA